MTTVKKKPLIVVVDDDGDVLDLIPAFFKPKGFQVICFSSAEVAMQEALASGQDWDVLLTDYHFNNMSGIEFTVEIKKILPTLPVILISPPEAANITLEIIKMGVYDAITKPIQFPQLQIAVDRALHVNDLTEDISALREKLKSTGNLQGNIIGRSPAFMKTLELAKRVSASAANIFITGESGTGKEVIAKYIHRESKRRKGPFVAINCSAIPENLLESELFGHAKGSFTGAHEKKVGLFEEAENGTLFLDEIGDLSASLQAKLLRVLQEKQIRRVGENQYRPINCRIISATHKDLSVEVKENRFREDLFYRLDVIPIHIPPLRDRPEDILPLAEAFLRRFALENGSPAKSFSKETVKYFLENSWHGNVRELENTVERAVVLSSTSEISLEDTLPLRMRGESPEADEELQSGNTFSVNCAGPLPPLDDVIRKYIEFAVAKKGGARDRTAKELGIDRKTLYKRLKLDDGLRADI